MIHRDFNIQFDRKRVEEIDALLRDNVAALVTHLLGTSGKRHGNEMRWGRKGGLCVMVVGRDKGRITRFDGDGDGRTPLMFIMEELRCSFPQALDWAANWLGLSPDYKPDPEVERRRKEEREQERHEAQVEERVEQDQRVAKAEAIVQHSVDAAGTPAEAYLFARGINVTHPDAIRFLPPENGNNGALVAIATNDARKVLAVQRIFIDGDKKAAIEVQKRTNGVMDGAAVRLPARQGEELVLVEGIETGLSVWQAYGRETWAALGSIAKLVDVVPTDRIVVIARDADVPNSPADKALNKAVMAMIERGVSVVIAMPPNPMKSGYDFNDALQDYGNEAVATALAQSVLTSDNALPEFKNLDDARAETKRIIQQFFDKAGDAQERPNWLVNVGLGIGKTKTALVEAGRHIKGTQETNGLGS